MNTTQDGWRNLTNGLKHSECYVCFKPAAPPMSAKAPPLCLAHGQKPVEKPKPAPIPFSQIKGTVVDYAKTLACTTAVGRHCDVDEPCAFHKCDSNICRCP